MVAGIDQRHAPVFCVIAMNRGLAAAHVEGDIGHMQCVVGEVLFDDVAFIAKTDHEVVYSVGRVHLHDVP
jgi:hypothetical protein